MSHIWQWTIHGLLFPNRSNVVVFLGFFLFTSSHRQDNTSRGAMGGDRREFLLNVFLCATYIFFKHNVTLKQKI